MFNETSIYVQISCRAARKDSQVYLAVNWLLRHTPCAEEYTQILHLKQIHRYLSNPTTFNPKGKLFSFKHSTSDVITCTDDKLSVYLKPNFANPRFIAPSTNQLLKPSFSANKTIKAKSRRRRAIIKKTTAGASDSSTADKSDADSQQSDGDKLSRAWADGSYLFLVEFSCARPSTADCRYEGDIIVRMKSSYGYLSASEYPFLIFYGVMCGVYVVFGLVWLLLAALNWRELLRLQLCIGAVILLGMLEKAFFLAEYEAINKTGQSAIGAVYFAHFVSCGKRTLARMLIMIVCVGYGIVKPRLGPALKKISGIGLVHFILALIEAYLQLARPHLDQSRLALFAAIPLVCVDLVIVWWSFSYLIGTLRQMRVRRNTVKYNVYRHFSNMLVLIICVSVLFMAWSVYRFRVYACVRAWRELWVDSAFWHILFSAILVVIMFLWRPSKNNQRYAYSPMLDAAADGGVGLTSDDEEKENGQGQADTNVDDGEQIIMENLASSGGLKKTAGKKDRKNRDKKLAASGEDSLKWLEENIPTSAVEQVYPLIDSEDESEAKKMENAKLD